MKKVILLAGVMLLQLSVLKAQYQDSYLSVPRVEVTGEAEMEIIPNKIYVEFELEEYYDGKSKTTIAEEERKLKKEITTVGLNVEKLTVADATSDYTQIRRKKDDVMANKKYQMILANATELEKLWGALSNVRVKNADVVKVDHTNIEEYKKEVKILAAKDAKNKATYLLEAVGNKPGKLLQLQERSYNTTYLTRKTNLMYSASYSDESATEQALEFKKMKLSYNVFAIFAVQQ